MTQLQVQEVAKQQWGGFCQKRNHQGKRTA